MKSTSVSAARERSTSDSESALALTETGTNSRPVSALALTETATNGRPVSAPATAASAPPKVAHAAGVYPIGPPLTVLRIRRYSQPTAHHHIRRVGEIGKQRRPRIRPGGGLGQRPPA